MKQIHIKAEKNERRTLKEWAELFQNRISAGTLAANHWRFDAFGLTVGEGFPMCALLMKEYLAFLEKSLQRKVGIVIELLEDKEVAA